MIYVISNMKYHWKVQLGFRQSAIEESWACVILAMEPNIHLM